MDRRRVDRRQFSRFAAATAIAGIATRATAGLGDTASRLTPPTQQIYDPPTSLAIVADMYRRMTAPLRIDGQGPFPFVVDTGANQSVISAELAASLGLPLGPVSQLNGVAGVHSTATTVASIGIGRRLRKDVTLFVLPAAAIGGAGILGLDGLDRQRVVFDFAGQTLRLEPGGRRFGDSRDVGLAAHRRDGQLTLVDADLDGIPIVAFIDSGAENTIGNNALRALARLRRPTDVWLTAPIVSVTGQTASAEVVNMPGLRLGGVNFSRWAVAFADLHIFNVWKLDQVPAILIGIDLLSRFDEVSLDFAINEVRFRRPDRPMVQYVSG